MKERIQKVSSFVMALIVCMSGLTLPAHASGISFDEGGVLGTVVSWLAGSAAFDAIWGTDHSGNYTANKPQAYYTTPTSSVEDAYGNVTNYYRGGDTTTTKIIDSYNQTFNTINNTTNTTTNYSANVKLSDFLNSYTTNNNNYTYSADFKSWYYDNTTNNYNYTEHNNYTQNNTYYNTDNSRYYISIDNSTDEYYLIDVQYSPTFVTVNYTYNNIDNSTHYGDVTNIYYFELTDGRNSSTLTADEVSGLDLGYDVTNYVLVTDDPNTLSLQHFDGDYTDSSSYGRDFYSVNRSTNYVDSGNFGQALQLPSGSSAGVTIPGLSNYDSLAFDFRIYYSNIANLGVYFGDTCLFQEVVPSRKWVGQDVYNDNGENLTNVVKSTGALLLDCIYLTRSIPVNSYHSFSYLSSIYYDYDGYYSDIYISDTLLSEMSAPSNYLSSGFVGESSYIKKYGWMQFESSSPILYSSNVFADAYITSCEEWGAPDRYKTQGTKRHYIEKEYRWSPSEYVLADFSYNSYANQWVSMRIVISGGNLYYFVNGDLAGSGAFTKPTADKFYISSTGTVYLDELRITTGDMVSTGAYTPSSAPYDTNKVLALPDELVANTIYVRHSTPVNGWRIGGVRPSNPTTGFFYLPLHEDYTGGQPQLYDGSNWVDVTAMVYDGSSVHDVIGYTFTPMGAAPDVDVDAKPERPTKPGEDVDPDTCTHEWEETGRTAATCTAPGSIKSTCSKCGTTKTESIPKLSHTWEVKTSVQTSYDDSGNIVTQGYTIYKCSVCGEEYKDTDGIGPPSASTPDDSDSEGGNWFTNLLKKIGEFLGTTIGGLLELLGTIIDKVLDSLIALVTNTIARLAELVDLFGSFGDALGVLWAWLPPEIVAVFVAGVTIFVFVALLKLFLK